jgi:DNA-binding GntR family transcriptional regulator
MTQTHEAEKMLREMILGLEIGPGESLSERGLEARLGASRTPIRAALMHLESEGLVRRDGRGWMASPIDLDELEQLFVYREALEVAAIRLVASRCDETALAGLEALIDSCGPDAPREEVLRAGQEFHVRLARMAGNDFITRGVTDALTRLSRARWLESNPEHHGWQEHRAIVAALRAGDAEQATRLVAAHVRQGSERLLARLRDNRRSLRANGVRVA